MDDILTQALAAATICKVLVDIVRQTGYGRGWVAPLLALSFGVAAALLLLLASGSIVTDQSVARAVLAGILAAGSAVGVTELQKRAP
jgi:hypothetical protein